MQTFIISGPQGCGKTRIASGLLLAGKVRGVVDEWCPGKPLKKGWAHCTNEPVPDEPPGVKVMRVGRANPDDTPPGAAQKAA